MKTIIILLLTLSTYGQVTKRILASGSTYNWKIEQMTDNGITATYFYLEVKEGKNSDGLKIGIVTKEELKHFIAYLRLYASYIDNFEHFDNSHSFSIIEPENSETLVLRDCKDHFLNLSKTSAKALSTEIGKYLNLM